MSASTARAGLVTHLGGKDWVFKTLRSVAFTGFDGLTESSDLKVSLWLVRSPLSRIKTVMGDEDTTLIGKTSSVQ